MAIGEDSDYLELPPNLDAREQRRRRVARFGEDWVRCAEALVDLTIRDTPGGLCRENVLALMEGAYSRGLAVDLTGYGDSRDGPQ